MPISRRNLIMAAAFLPGCLKAADKADPSRMIVRSPRPEDLEMPLDGFADWLTPVERFFVRCHTYTPTVDLREWRLRIDGLVERPSVLTMEEIRRFPRVEFAAVLQCAGSGRKFYEPRVSGTQWANGGVGNGTWAGVRLRDILKTAGVKTGALNVFCDGADVPLGKMPDFQRTVAIDKALHPDTLLAYEMNGQPLPVEHGFPLRLIAPGWAGDSWVKWLQHIEVLDHEFEGFWMKTAYRHPSHSIQPGAAVDPKDMIPVTDLNVNSVIATPVGWTRPGTVRIQGTAWSNSSPITKVSVSCDGGNRWNPAKLIGPRTKYGWRAWQYDWKAAAGEYSLVARATNAEGRTQPLTEEWNPSGYLYNVAQVSKVSVSSQAPVESAAADASSPMARPEGYSACLNCHDESMMSQQRLTPAQWDRELDKMIGWGANVKPQNRDSILKYLSGKFKTQ